MKEYAYTTNQNKEVLLKNLSAVSAKKISQEGIYAKITGDNIQLMYYPGYQYHRGHRGIFVVRFWGHLEFMQNSIILRGRYKMDAVSQFFTWPLVLSSLSIIAFLWVSAFSQESVDNAFLLPAIVLTLGCAIMIFGLIRSNKNYIRYITDFMKHQLELKPYINKR